MPRVCRVMHAGNMAVRCLIVDDNREFLHAASELLEREGLSVVGVASTAAQAVSTCRELQPDVVLLDIDLGGGETGFDIARQLAAAPATRQSPVILISAYSGEDFQELIIESPAVSFLAKADLSGQQIQRILAGDQHGLA
jgi:CheY-like chemotaxis protein